MKIIRPFIFVLALLSVFHAEAAAEPEQKNLFKTIESKEEFSRDISSMIGKAWKKWQDEVAISNVHVEGSQGMLFSGDMRGPVLTVSAMLEEFDRSDKSQDYIDCVRAVAGALENGIRSWQRGYGHENIPFPRGASCVYTLPPTYSVPVAVGTGWSTGDGAMTEDALYNYMLYRVPYYEEDVLLVFRAAAKAISECFVKWGEICYIDGILAEGGVAPQPAPMGPGPGLVKGARGKGGKLSGAYFDGSLMHEKMREYLTQRV